jgi:DNA (cytosine-5)-methyltransferase 3A
MNVLSLFDGISCARVALDRAGIEVNAYMAAEIDKNAIKVSDKNYPDIIRVGSVVGLEVEGQIDLLIGGSPCQDLSIAKKDRKGLDGNRSGLFWEFVRIKKECNPQWFVLENVASMPKADRDIITREMGVEPVMFNASLVSAQCRKRLFWTNIPFDLPEDRGILLKDILQPDGEVDERMVVKGKSYTLTASYSKATPSPAQVEHNIEKGQRTMVRGRDVLLTESPLQVLQEGRTELGKQSRKEIKKETGKDSTSRSGGHKAYFGKDGTKANCLTTALGAEGLIVKPDCIRKLTPIECERLQGLPDNYTEGVATTNRYKCLGNAFNVDVVAHILGRIKLMY